VAQRFAATPRIEPLALTDEATGASPALNPFLNAVTLIGLLAE
jgi:hypothetical protein